MLKLRTVDDLSPLEQMAVINMSYSRLDSYDMCPSKYYYTYIQKEERVFGPAASLGNIVHSVLEDHVGGDLEVDPMLESMEKHRETYDPDKQIDNKLLTVGRTLIGEFVDNHKDDTFDIIGKELPFSLLIGTANVIGYIDLVARESGRIRITDYKTGTWEVAAKNIPDNLQVGIYALACSQLFPGEDIHAELYYLRSGRRKGHTFTPDDLDDVYERVLEKVNIIINDQNFKATEEVRPCTFCDFAKTKVCPAGTSRMRNRRW